jgi:hypothetical protein
MKYLCLKLMQGATLTLCGKTLGGKVFGTQNAKLVNCPDCIRIAKRQTATGTRW